MKYLENQLRSLKVHEVAVIGGQNVTCLGENFTINDSSDILSLSETIAEIVGIINEYNRDADEFESALRSMRLFS